MRDLLSQLLIPSVIILILVGWWYPEQDLVHVSVIDRDSTSSTSDLEKEANEEWTTVLETAMTHETMGYMSPRYVPLKLDLKNPVIVDLSDGSKKYRLKLIRKPIRSSHREQLPSNLIYPMRDWWPLMLFALAGAVAIRKSDTSLTKERRAAHTVAFKTTHGRRVIWGLVITIAGFTLFVAFFAYYGSLKELPPSFAIASPLIIFFGSLLTLANLSPLQIVKRLLSAQELWVRWSLSDQVWLDAIELHQRERKEKNGTILIGTAILIILINGYAFFFESEEWNEVILFDIPSGFLIAFISIGIFILIAMTTWLSPIIWSYNMRRSPREVYIGPNAVCIGEQTHILKKSRAQFEQAYVESNPNPRLFVCYNQSHSDADGHVSTSRTSVPIPVPTGCENQAQQIAERLNQHYSRATTPE